MTSTFNFLLVLCAFVLIVPTIKGQYCLFQQCSVANCSLGCDGCLYTTTITITTNMSSVCPEGNSGSFCFTGFVDNDDACEVANCATCSDSSDPTTCIGCQNLTAYSAQSYCDSVNCYTLYYNPAGAYTNTTNTTNDTTGSVMNVTTIQTSGLNPIIPTVASSVVLDLVLFSVLLSATTLLLI